MVLWTALKLSDIPDRRRDKRRLEIIPRYVLRCLRLHHFENSFLCKLRAVLTGRICLLCPADASFAKVKCLREKKVRAVRTCLPNERMKRICTLFFFFSYVRFKLDWRFVERFCGIQKVLFPSCTSQSALMFGTLLVVTLTGERCYLFIYFHCEGSYT